MHTAPPPPAARLGCHEVFLHARGVDRPVRRRDVRQLVQRAPERLVAPRAVLRGEKLLRGGGGAERVGPLVVGADGSKRVQRRRRDRDQVDPAGGGLGPPPSAGSAGGGRSRNADSWRGGGRCSAHSSVSRLMTFEAAHRQAFSDCGDWSTAGRQGGGGGRRRARCQARSADPGEELPGGERNPAHPPLHASPSGPYVQSKRRTDDAGEGAGDDWFKEVAMMESRSAAHRKHTLSSSASASPLLSASGRSPQGPHVPSGRAHDAVA